MTEYRILLALQYFKEYRESYSISSLMQKLGLTLKQVDSLIDQMIDKKLLKYEDYLLIITEKGRRIIIANNMQYYKIDNNHQNNKIFIDKALSLDSPYVPNRFSKKYNA